MADNEKLTYVVSHRRAVTAPGVPREAAAEKFATVFATKIAPNVDLVDDAPGGAADHATADHATSIQATPDDVAKMKRELPPDTIIELEKYRTPASLSLRRSLPPLPEAPSKAPTEKLLAFNAFDAIDASDAVGATDAAGGASAQSIYTVTFVSGNQPSPNALVTLQLRNTAGQNFSATTTTDANGTATLAYDAWYWPTALQVEPLDAWQVILQSVPPSGSTVPLQPLPRGGPLGWWSLVSGARPNDVSAGSGIRIGIVDTGVGPHPALANVHGVGAFVGNFQPGAQAAADSDRHGTHVTGIIAGRPVQAGEYAGIARGADVFVIRVFGPGPGATARSGDIANAIRYLTEILSVDIINLSLGGDDPTFVERDAIQIAQQAGAIAICAAGNTYGMAPVQLPAAYPESVAVTGLGMVNTYPAGTLAAQSVPPQPDQFGSGGLFFGYFNAIGPQIACAAPGSGVISTVPGVNGSGPYADMVGNSMAAPLVTGVLAAMLARDPTYRALPHDVTRWTYVRSLLNRTCVGIGLAAQYAGSGIAHEAGGP